MWPISDRVRMQPCHPGSRPCVATRRFCYFKSSSYNLPCPYLVSHISPVSAADLGWSYACAHHSLMVTFAYLFNLSFIHIFTQWIFTKPLSQVFMSSGWHEQESSFLSPLLQILPFRLCSRPSLSYIPPQPMQPAWRPSSWMLRAEKGVTQFTFSFTGPLWALILSHCPVRSLKSGGPSQRTCSFHIHHGVVCILDIQETFFHPVGEWINGAM